MKQAVIRLNYAACLIVPTKDLSKILGILEGAQFVDSTWIGNEKVWYHEEQTTTVELLPADITIHPGYDTVKEMREQYEARKAAEAEAVEEN